MNSGFIQTIPNKENDENGIQEDFQNLFDSIAMKDIKKRETYYGILEGKVVKEQQTFDTMKEELRIGQTRNANKKRNFYKQSHVSENVVAKKRETNETNQSIDYIIDTFLRMDPQERKDIIKYLDPHIAAEFRSLPPNPARDRAALKRLREHISYNSAMMSVRESIKYVYVRDVARHANKHFVKLNKTIGKKKITLNKNMWMDFLRDPQSNGTGPIIRKLLLERNASIDEFSDFMLWVYDFTYNWLDIFRRVPRYESIDPAKYGWPFTRRHLDLVNIFRESLNKDPLKMIWLDITKDLVLPQIEFAESLVAGTKESWEELGLY